MAEAVPNVPSALDALSHFFVLTLPPMCVPTGHALICFFLSTDLDRRRLCQWPKASRGSIEHISFVNTTQHAHNTPVAQSLVHSSQKCWKVYFLAL